MPPREVDAVRFDDRVTIGASTSRCGPVAISSTTFVFGTGTAVTCDCMSETRSGPTLR